MSEPCCSPCRPAGRLWPVSSTARSRGSSSKSDLECDANRLTGAHDGSHGDPSARGDHSPDSDGDRYSHADPEPAGNAPSNDDAGTHARADGDADADAHTRAYRDADTASHRAVFL